MMFRRDPLSGVDWCLGVKKKRATDTLAFAKAGVQAVWRIIIIRRPVSYTHLTLPTILRV